jgi:hypothetical protein
MPRKIAERPPILREILIFPPPLGPDPDLTIGSGRLCKGGGMFFYRDQLRQTIPSVRMIGRPSRQLGFGQLCMENCEKYHAVPIVKRPDRLTTNLFP